jgi:hypothetical protein
MSTIGELGAFLARETAAVAAHTPPADETAPAGELPLLGMQVPTAPSNGDGVVAPRS